MNILIYIFPALMDAIIAQTLFVNGIRLAKMGAADWLISGIWSIWSLPYVCFCLAAPRFLNERNTVKFMLVSCGLIVLQSVLYPFTAGPVSIALLTVLNAVAAGFFFPTFQVFMKTVSVRNDKPLSHSIAFYTASWSTGFALGPFISGYILEAGPAAWKYSYLVGGGVALVAGVGIWFMRRFGKPQAGDATEPAPASVPAQAAPDLAWLGWVAALAALSVIAVIRSLLPAMAEKEIGLPESRQGLVLFLISISQALIGLALCRSRTWMYRPSRILVFGTVGVLGALGFAFSRSLGGLCVSAVLSGLYIGSFFFYLGYHSLVHPTRSVRYISMNEVVVGVTGFLAPASAGLLSDVSHSYVYPYLVGAVLLGAMVLFQVAVHIRRPLPRQPVGP